MSIRAASNTAKTFFKPYLNQSRLYSSAPYPIPQLPVLDKLVDLAQNRALPNLDRTVIIGVQHLLETTATLFQSLIKLGIKPENMFFAGKCYSTSPVIAKTIEDMGINLIHGSIPKYPGAYQAVNKEDVKNLWQQFKEASKKREIDRVIILDDGGRCIEEMPRTLPFYYYSACIEQTRGGLYSSSIDRLASPLIEVATSAVKRHIESPLIAEAILSKVKHILPKLNLNKDTVCAVVGNGAVGNEMVKYLSSLGQTVICYDEDPAVFKDISGYKPIRMQNLETLLANCTHVFGCTGRDITKGIDVFDIAAVDDMHFISCTSEDKEFASLLKRIAEENKRMYFEPLSDITCWSNNQSKITIYKSGFPVNFDRKPWNVPARDIEITQGLLLSACLQAITTAMKKMDTQDEKKRQMLAPHLQQIVLKEWLKGQSAEHYSKELLDKFNDIEWIKTNSGGVYYPNPIFIDKTVDDSKKSSKYRYTSIKC